MPVLIFARAPVAGRCKTRLIPHLSARGAAWVQRRLVEHALRIATEAAVGTVTLVCAPHAAHPFFARLHRQTGLRLQRQCGGDLGRRMRHAINRALRTPEAAPVLLIGADAFDLQAADLQAVAAAISDYQLIPAPDGGYGLLGARKPLPRLIGVRWSSGREAAQTLRRLRAAGRVAAHFSARADFDHASDWRRARQSRRLGPLARTGR